jgi:hypothetical protein
MKGKIKNNKNVEKVMGSKYFPNAVYVPGNLTNLKNGTTQTSTMV